MSTDAYMQQSQNYLLNTYTHYPITLIRGIGLMLGIELKSMAQEILAYCQNAGLLLNITAQKVLRMLPPYIATETDVNFAINVMEAAFKKFTR